MSVLEVDSKGRILLPRKDRERIGIGKRVLAINLGDHLEIIPLPSDAIAELDGTLNINKPFEKLRKEAEDRAMAEAGGHHIAPDRE